MLVGLDIRDILIIDHAEILFTNGLNVLTGETGAGKSILLIIIIPKKTTKITTINLINIFTIPKGLPLPVFFVNCIYFYFN